MGDAAPSNLTHSKGEVWLVDFWATWCPPCQAPMQHNQDMLEKRAADWAGKVRIIGLSIDNTMDAVQKHVESFGYGVVRELVGHGVGKNLHESPEVPNYGRRGRGAKLQEGLVIAIEPMINMGTRKIMQHNDGWTITTIDNKPSAHFEHTIVVRKGKAEILSSFKEIEKKING